MKSWAFSFYKDLSLLLFGHWRDASFQLSDDFAFFA